MPDRDSRQSAQMIDVLVAVLLTYVIMVAGHFALEIFIILTQGEDELEPCGFWWCPEHWVKSIEARFRPPSR
jgi:hypothetical protein